MAHFSQQRIRSIIFAIWEACPNGATTFWEALTACHAGKWDRNQTGFQLQSTSGAGYAQSFHVPMSTSDPSNITDATLQDTFFAIIEAYQTVQSNGLSEGDAGNPAFLAALMAQFPTIKGYTNNFNYVTT